jgi:pyridoxine 4-dehydrogenase
MPDLFSLGGDLPVDRLGFGAMRLPRNDRDTSARDPETGRTVLRRAVELGVNHIDTADFYRSADGSVRANTLIRQALAPYAPGLVVDRLDLVYLRIGMMTVPHGESLGDRFRALAAMRDEGLIRHLGISNVDTGQLAEARTIAPVAAVQNNFHLGNRDETAVLEACAQAGIAFVPYFPLGGGRADIDHPSMAKVAARHQATTAQIALPWLLALSPVTLAIPGTGSVAHLEENLAARSIALSPDDLSDLE